MIASDEADHALGSGSSQAGERASDGGGHDAAERAPVHDERDGSHGHVDDQVMVQGAQQPAAAQLGQQQSEGPLSARRKPKPNRPPALQEAGRG